MANPSIIRFSTQSEPQRSSRLRHLRHPCGMAGSLLAPITFRSENLDVITGVTRGHTGAFPHSKPGLVRNCHLNNYSLRSTTRDHPCSIMLIDPDQGHCIHSSVNRQSEPCWSV